MINLSNFMDLELFTKDNISEYNAKPSKFTAKELLKEIRTQLSSNEQPLFTSSEIDIYLSERFRVFLESDKRTTFEAKLDALSGSKSTINDNLREIANTEILAFSEVQKYYVSRILKNIQVTYETSMPYRQDIFNKILAYNAYATICNTSDQVSYISNDLRHAIDKALYLAIVKGFTKENVDVNTGTKVANEGDSAQFLFLARAVLAGYTCSNVDVRSCRYDAVIDYEGHLLKVQIKGISGTSIILKDRDRGGAGIDPTALRNKGKYISSKEIDLYVAVDKQFGICYIIPATDIDAWIKIGKKSIAVSRLGDYKENWNNISIVARSLHPTT